MHLTRKLSAAMAGFALSATGLLGIGLAVAPTANAAPAVASTSCTKASATATIKPGLTFVKNKKKQTLSAKFKASGCKKVSGATGYSGTITLTSKNLTCVSGAASGPFTDKSNNKKVASGTMTLTATSKPLVFNLTGKITKGLLKGSSIKGKFTASLVKGGGNCSTTPLTKATIANNGAFKL